MLTTFNNDTDLLKMVITGDESWVYGYDIETKAQSSQQQSQDRNLKALLTVFYGQLRQLFE